MELWVRLLNPPETPYLPFIRMHQASSELHIRNCDEPLTEEAFYDLLGKYSDETVPLNRWPTGYPPYISRTCTHARHPILTSNTFPLSHEYFTHHLCSVCTIRQSLHHLKVIKHLWNTHFARKTARQKELRRYWFAARADLANQLSELEAMAAMEPEFCALFSDQQSHSVESDYISFFSAGAALAIADYAAEDWSPPAIYKTPVTENIAALRSPSAASSSPSTPRTPSAPPTPVPAPPVGKRVSFVLAPDYKDEDEVRKQYLFDRDDERYEPGRYACPDEEGWENTSDPGDGEEVVEVGELDEEGWEDTSDPGEGEEVEGEELDEEILEKGWELRNVITRQSEEWGVDVEARVLGELRREVE
jgi:hypothetical protein